MEAKLIDLDEWEAFGAGGIGQSYFNRTDDSVILKLNSPAWDKEKSEVEVLYSVEVQKLGLPTPTIYEFVTDGQRYGHIDQRIKGKKSLARLLADDPSRIDEMARVMAEMSRTMHTTPCNTDVFEDKVSKYIKGIDLIPCSDEIKEKLRSYMSKMDHSKTCIHGDLQVGNLITADGKYYWIDLGAFGYGDPAMDLGNMYLLLYIMPPQLTKSLFHMEHKDMDRFYRLFLKYYFNGEPSREDMEKIRCSAYVKAGMVLYKFPKIGKLFLPLLEGKMLKFKIIRFLASFAKLEL